jgi:hypothetical protein
VSTGRTTADKLTAFEVAEERANRAASRSFEVIEHSADGIKGLLRRSLEINPPPNIDKYIAEDFHRVIDHLQQIRDTMIRTFIKTLGSSLEIEPVQACVESALDTAYNATFKDNLLCDLEGKEGWITWVKKLLAARDWQAARLIEGVSKELQIAAFEVLNKKPRPREASHRQDKTITPAPQVSFMKDEALKTFVSVVSQEACRCFDSQCFNAAAVLAGSAAEAILLDLLRQQDASVVQSATKSREPLEKWRLDDLIRVALKLKLLQESTRSLNEFLQNQRNLVHPGRALREKSLTGVGQAQIALGILTHICEELARGPSAKSSTSRPRRGGFLTAPHL